MAGPRVSVVVVSFNTRELTLACLAAVREAAREVPLELIVVDNASDDGSADAIAERYPEARLLRPGRNLGFARANNLAARDASGEYLLLLNPDTVLQAGALAAALAFAERTPEAGIVGGRTLFDDGTLNPSSCWGRPTLWSAFCHAVGFTSIFRRSRLFDPESLGRWPRDSVREVDIVSGCFLLMRRELWQRLEGFDESFFMYGEDADLCLRARALGSRCVVFPGATLVHHGGASERVRADKMVRLFQAKARLFHKHWRPLAARVGVRLLDQWALTRAAALWLLRHVRPSVADAARTWRDVWSRRREWRVALGSAPARGLTEPR